MSIFIVSITIIRGFLTSRPKRLQQDGERERESENEKEFARERVRERERDRDHLTNSHLPLKALSIHSTEHLLVAYKTKLEWTPRWTR